MAGADQLAHAYDASHLRRVWDRCGREGGGGATGVRRATSAQPHPPKCSTRLTQVYSGGALSICAARISLRVSRARAARVYPLAAHVEAEEAEANAETLREPVRIRIAGEWYDARAYARAHPGGARWIRWFDGRDATAVFYALHSYGANGSKKAAERLARLPKCDPPAGSEVDSGVGALPSDEEHSREVAFRALRERLENEGFFKRVWWKEAWALGHVLALYAAGTAVAASHPFAACALLGLGMQQAGWLAHDYIHGRGKWCEMMRPIGAFLNGHSAEWWTQKHSLHHCFTNEEELDHDIMMEPFYFLRSPSESGRPDSKYRKYQHIYGYPLISIMFWLWRWLSFKDVLKRGDRKEAVLLGCHYAFLFTCLPLPVAIGSVFVGGFLVGSLVSATHQSEEIMVQGDQPDYVTGQFRSTRDADTVFGPLETWLWGGMDTQLAHHLFPSMPRYNYHRLRPILQAWAADQGTVYRISPSTKIIADNFNTLRRVAMAP